MAAHEYLRLVPRALALVLVAVACASPSWAADTTLPTPANFDLPFQSDDPEDSIDVLNAIIAAGIGYVGIFSVLVLIYGGVLMIISYGEEDKTKTARLVITYALVGVITAGAAYFLVNIVNNIRL